MNGLKKAYTEILVEQAPDSLQSNDVPVGSKCRRDKSVPERQLDVPDLRVVDPIIYRFSAAVGYQKYRLLKK